MNFPEHEFGCIICNGVSKTKCNFCGFKKPQKDKTPVEEWNRWETWDGTIKYLQKTRHKLKVENMVTTGCPELDAKIIHYLGRWTTKRIVTFVNLIDLPGGPFWEKVKEKIFSEVRRMFDGRVRLIQVEYSDIKVFNCVFDGKEKDIMDCVEFLINDLFDTLDAYV